MTPAQRFVAAFETPPEGIEWELAPGHDAELQSVPNLVDLLNIKRTGPKGIGALAMAQLCRKADDMNIDIQLSVRPQDSALISYYEAFGFRETSPKNSYRYVEMLRIGGRRPL